MNGNDLLNALTDVDEKHILQAEKKPPNKRRIFIGAMSAVAAAAAIAVFVAVAGHTGRPGTMIDPDVLSSVSDDGDINSDNSISDSIKPIAPSLPSISDYQTEPDEPFTVDENLPKLTPQIDNGLPGGGLGGGLSYSWIPSSPWSEDMDFKSLPVYHSSTADPDYEIMTERLQFAVEALGYDISEMTISDTYVTKEDEQSLTEQFKGYGAPDEEIARIIRISKIMSQVSASNDDLTVYVRSDYSINVWIDHDEKSIEFPKESDDITDEMSDYLLGTYGYLFGLENPVLNSRHSNSGVIELYEGGTDLEQFLNYNLNKVYIAISTDYDVIYIDTDSGFEKLGDYPIISVNKAVEELRNGNYFTRYDDYEIIGNEPIGKIDLAYFTGVGYEYVMPYYCIYVGMTYGETFDEDELTYKIYYIPAVRGEYLENITPEIIPGGVPVA